MPIGTDAEPGSPGMRTPGLLVCGTNVQARRGQIGPRTMTERNPVARLVGRCICGPNTRTRTRNNPHSATTFPILIFGSTNNASARGLMGISKERHSYRKAHTHIFFECRPKCGPTGNAKQRCSLSAGLPIGFVMAKPPVARLERTRPRKQRLILLEVQELRSSFSLCPPFC